MKAKYFSFYLSCPIFYKFNIGKVVGFKFINHPFKWILIDTIRVSIYFIFENFYYFFSKKRSNKNNFFVLLHNFPIASSGLFKCSSVAEIIVMSAKRGYFFQYRKFCFFLSSGKKYNPHLYILYHDHNQNNQIFYCYFFFNPL